MVKPVVIERWAAKCASGELTEDEVREGLTLAFRNKTAKEVYEGVKDKAVLAAVQELLHVSAEDDSSDDDMEWEDVDDVSEEEVQRRLKAARFHK